MQDRFTISESDDNGGLIMCRNSQGSELQGTALQIERHRIVFETYNPSLVLRTSEVLSDFLVRVSDREVYSGSAVVATVVHAGTATVCEARLSEGWTDLDPAVAGSPLDLREQLRTGFGEFIRRWQKFHKILPEYKAVIGEAQTLLTDLRLWLEGLELSVRSAPDGDRIQLEQEIADQLRSEVTSTLNNLFERFEVISAKIEDDLQTAHRVFGQRHLHPHLLCAPFIYRTYSKPLGYAGDYEMMNMMIRNRCEGASLYAKLVNGYLLDQDAPQAVRNRVHFLKSMIVEETSRVSRLGRIANVFCVGCGPAWEVVNFLEDHPLAERAQFHLLDFNEETLQYVGDQIGELRQRGGRKTPVKLIKNSVQNLLRGAGKTAADGGKFDLIYCSGLYDYLTNRICKALNTYLYDLLQPGGTLLVGNFAPSTRCQKFMEHFSEWFLIYRSAKELTALAPTQAENGSHIVRAEDTGSNIFLEVRKPK